MQSKELIMTKINVAKTITEIASEGKSPPCEMINSVTKLLNIAIVNPQYKSRPLVWLDSADLSGLHPEQRKHAAQKYPAFDAYE